MIDPPHPKMLIAIMYELLESRKLLSDISFDFDPEKVLGPPCGPDMVDKIKHHSEKYGFKLNDY